MDLNLMKRALSISRLLSSACSRTSTKGYYGFLAPLALYGGLAFIVRRNRLKQEAGGEGKEDA
jgi:hypothetical protein